MENNFDTNSYLNMELLRFTTAGSVDDGKSTLIGRLLYDSKSIFEDQVAQIEATGIRSGEAERIIRKHLDEADELMRKGQVFDAKEIWNSILELYEENDGVQPLVMKAEQRLEELKRMAD